MKSTPVALRTVVKAKVSEVVDSLITIALGQGGSQHDQRLL
jgi:hypothetical protein